MRTAMLTCDACGHEVCGVDRHLVDWRHVELMVEGNSLRLLRDEWDLCPRCAAAFADAAKLEIELVGYDPSSGPAKNRVLGPRLRLRHMPRGGAGDAK